MKKCIKLIILSTIQELLTIKQTRCTIEMLRKTVKQTGYQIINEQLYFINPHYKIKFGLAPRKLNRIIAHIPFIRNVFSTSCFYLIKPTQHGSTIKHCLFQDATKPLKVIFCSLLNSIFPEIWRAYVKFASEIKNMLTL